MMTDWRQGNKFDLAALKYGFKNRNQVIATQNQMQKAGFNIGKFGVDGKWGQDSMRAYELWKKKGFTKASTSGALQKIGTKRVVKRLVTPQLNNGFWDKAKYVFSGREDSDTNAAGRLAELLGAKKNGIISEAAELGSYFIPGVGSGLALNEALNNARDGNWLGAGMNALFALPVIGGVGKALTAGAKFAKTASTAGKLINTGNRLSKFGNISLKVANYGIVPVGMATGVGFGIKSANDQGKELRNVAQQQGLTRDDLYDEYKDLYDVNGFWSGLGYSGKQIVDDYKNRWNLEFNS